MPRQSDKRKAIVTEVMREAIFEAAASVLCQHGISGTTMHRVAEAANLTKSNLYNYFRDKDELLQFFNTRLVQPFLEAIEEISKSDLPALQKLEKILRAMREYSFRLKGLIRLIREGDRESEIRKNIRPRIVKIFTAIFEQGIREGVFRSHNPEHTGRILHGALAEFVELLAEGASDDELNSFVESLIDGIQHGFSFQTEKSPAGDAWSPNSSN